MALWGFCRIEFRNPSYFRHGDENLLPRISLEQFSATRTETEMARPSRHVLPQDLNTAIKQLDDQELDRLVVVALAERSRRKKPPLPEESQRNQRAEADAAPLPLGKLNAVRAAFKAGVSPARIAREFGLSQSNVRKALAGHANKQ